MNSIAIGIVKQEKKKARIPACFLPSSYKYEKN